MKIVQFNLIEMEIADFLRNSDLSFSIRDERIRTQVFPFISFLYPIYEKKNCFSIYLSGLNQ